MKIEVGGKYKSRNGDIKTIVKFVAGSRFPYKSEEGVSFTDKGEYLGGEPHVLDLIEEVVEKAVNKPLFEVGKEYETRDGRLCRILSYHEGQKRPYFVETRQPEGDWTVGPRFHDGRSSNNASSNNDVMPPTPEIEISDAVLGAFFLNKKGLAPVKRENAPHTIESLKAVIRTYLAEQKEVGKGDIV